jgi:hypothetical protein
MPARLRRRFRTPGRLAAATITAVSLLAGVAPAHATSQPTTSRLSATASPLTVLTHNTVVIAGAVSPRGAGVVTLQRYSAGRWVQVSHKPVGKTGSYSFAVHTSGTAATTIYRVTRPASATAKALVSKTMHVHVVKTAYKVKAVASHAVAGGTPIVVTGSVSPKAKGTVRLEVLLHGAWHEIASAKLGTKSTYSLHQIEPTGGYALRVRSPLSSTIASGVSPSVKVTVTPPTTAAPTAAITLSGTAVGPGVYSGTVTATAKATAAAGVKSLSYVLDGAAAKPYTAPVPVSAAGSHSLTVTVTDLAGRLASATANWTITPKQVDTPLPSATIALAGSLGAGGVYTSSVTATVTATATALSPLKSVTYALDGGAQTTYTQPLVVSSTGTHTLIVTVTDLLGRVGSASATWQQTTLGPDSTPPTVAVTIAGTGTNGTYTGHVSVSAIVTDAASGVQSVTYTLDGQAPVAYTEPFVVSSNGSHTVTFTATDFAGNVSAPAVRNWTQVSGASQPLVVSTTDQTTLNLSTPRLVFSSYRGGPAAAPRLATLTNFTGTDIHVTGVSFSGADASQFRLTAGQSLPITVPAGATATISVDFNPLDPTGCPTGTTPPASVSIGNVNRSASLVLTLDASGESTATADLAGVNACSVGGNSEPVLDQLLSAFGYTTNTYNGYDRRVIGPSRWVNAPDEIESPYFNAADSAQPVTLTPIAHYGGPNTAASYAATGWYAQGAAMSATSSCSSACKQLWSFPGDPSSSTYNENQKVLPTPNGTTSFTPTGTFGIYSGDFSDVNFSDDSLNIAHSTANTDVPTKHYLHDLRIYPAYGPGHAPIPNTYIVGVDITRVPAYKNNDYQDLVLLLTNAKPATPQGRVLTTSGNNLDLTKGGTVSNTCAVSGFDGVMPSSIGANPCAASNISFTTNGLQIVSTPGQLAEHNQQNALYQTFDASRGAFTIKARVSGSTDQLQHNYQQIGAFFGPDDRNFIKIEAEHNGTPGLTLFYVDNGVGGTVTSTSPANLTSASTLDLVIKGNTQVPDPLPYGDQYHVSGYPLDELTVWYSINGAPLTQIGTTIEFPANVTSWFSRQAKAGILVASPSSATPITATFNSFSIAAG